MADSQEKKTSLETKKNNNLIFIYLFILTIAIIAIGFNQFYISKTYAENQKNNESNIDKQNSYIETFLKNLSNSTEKNFSNIFEKQQAQIDIINNKLDKKSQNPNGIADIDKLEINFLIKTAKIQLEVFNNPKRAILLLEQAKKLILEQDNNEKLLEAVNTDINNLDKINFTDKDQLLKITTNTVNNILANMQDNLKTNLNQKLNKNLDNSLDNNSNKNLGFKEQLINKLEDIVVIKKHNTIVKPILDDYENNLVILKFNLYFEALGLSIIESDSETYTMYLDKITTLLDSYNLNNPDITKNLTKLKKAGFNNKININLESLNLIYKL